MVVRSGSKISTIFSAEINRFHSVGFVEDFTRNILVVSKIREVAEGGKKSFGSGGMVVVGASCSGNRSGKLLGGVCRGGIKEENGDNFTKF